MNYKESLDFLFSQLPMFSRTGAAAYKPGLDTSIQLDNFFGNPHTKFKSIHIAGTNGKGSTSSMLAAILQCQGYKTALYTSPHLLDFRERMRINGEMIPEDHVIDFVERYRKSGYQGHPSFFELTMMMAFDWFAKEQVDYAVIEVGMGGRLDSTNIITPEACIITNISKDHTQFLGDTLAKIAGEKAGIIKHAIPVTIGEAEGEVKTVFQLKATEVEAPIRFAQDYPELIKAEPEGFGYACYTKTFGQLYCSLGGEYQKHNINTVLCALPMLRNCGIKISDNAVKEGLADVNSISGLRGRWDTILESPLTICDTGHNEAGLSYNLTKLHNLRQQKGGTLRIVLGFVADKNVDEILEMFPKDALYYFCNAQIPRALPADQLTEKAHRAGLTGNQYESVGAAYLAAHKDACRNQDNDLIQDTDIVYVGGSTFIVADFLAYLDSAR